MQVAAISTAGSSGQLRSRVSRLWPRIGEATTKDPNFFRRRDCGEVAFMTFSIFEKKSEYIDALSCHATAS
jgi:hypothetical protein